MADSERVGSDGWISDESHFYGDEDVQAKFERRAHRRLKRTYEQSWPQCLVPAKRVKLDAQTDPEFSLNDASLGEQNVLDFLRSRPQFVKLEAEDLLDDGRDLGRADSWERGKETVLEFLRRLPVSDPSTANFGPWLWVSAPKQKYQWKEREEKCHLDSFMVGADLLFEAFQQQRSKKEQQNSGKTVATFTRKMGSYRDQLEEDLLTLAVKTGTTCGKWMFFPLPDDLPRYWRQVAEATADGKLGPTSKVATFEPNNLKKGTLICVYTYDFTDMADVKRVLLELEELGLVARDARPIYYKCDAYTYCGLNSDNQYKIKASLYSSKEIFLGEAKAKAKAKSEGPIARLRKRKATVHSFFAS